MKKIDLKPGNKKLTSILVIMLATCFVIGLLSSTAIKLASASLYMRNSKLKINNSTIADIADDLGLPVEPVKPSGDDNDNGNSDATDKPVVDDTKGDGDKNETPADDKTDDKTDVDTDTDAPSDDNSGSDGGASDNSGDSDSSGDSGDTDSDSEEKPSGSGDSEDKGDSGDSSGGSILDSVMGIIGSLGIGGSGGNDDAEEEQEPGSTKVDISKKDALKTYSSIVNKAKIKMPGFVKTTTRSADFIATLVVNQNPDYFVENQAVEVKGKKANTDLCIDNNKLSACLLTGADAAAVKSASKEVLANGNVKLVITLNDETNPVPLKANAVKSESYTSAMFSVTTADKVKAMVDGALNSDVKDTSLTYKDCTVTLVYNPKTGAIVSLRQTTSYVASMKTSILPFEFTVNEVVDYTNFKY